MKLEATIPRVSIVVPCFGKAAAPIHTTAKQRKDYTGDYTVWFLVGNGGMDYGDYYCGLYRDYYTDPFLHSLIRPDSIAMMQCQAVKSPPGEASRSKGVTPRSAAGFTRWGFGTFYIFPYWA